MNTSQFADNLITRYLYPRLFRYNLDTKFPHQEIINLITDFLQKKDDMLDLESGISDLSEKICDTLFRDHQKSNWDLRFPLPQIKNEIRQYLLLKLEKEKKEEKGGKINNLDYFRYSTQASLSLLAQEVPASQEISASGIPFTLDHPPSIQFSLTTQMSQQSSPNLQSSLNLRLPDDLLGQEAEV